MGTRKTEAARGRRAADQDATGHNDLQLHYTPEDPEMQGLTLNLLQILTRGGNYSYYWTKSGKSKKTHWWPVGDPDPIPNGDTANVYFGVHPSEIRRGPYHRAKKEHVAAINCLFADADGKHFEDKAAALTHLENLDPRPSVIIDSGGGYHAYWLLQEPYALTTASKRERAENLQRRWVQFVGGDPGAKDLARVLRVPGTLNLKEKYGPDYPTVHFVQADLDRRYTLDTLETLLPEPEPEPRPHAGARTIRDRNADRVRKYVLAALEDEARLLATTAAGGRNDQANKSAFNVAGYMWTGAVTRSEIERALYDACVSNGLVSDDGANSVERTIRSGLDDGADERRPIPERDARRTPPEGQSSSEARSTSAEVAGDRQEEKDDPGDLLEKAREEDDRHKRAKIWTRFCKAIQDLSTTERAAWIDEAAETGLVTKGTLRDQLGDEDGGGRQLRTEDYIRLFETWNYRLKLNECNDGIELNGERITDIDEQIIKSRIRDYGIDTGDKVNVSHAVEAIIAGAQQNAYHPIRDWLESLEWNGQDHISRLTDHVTDKRDNFARWLNHWLVGAVAHVYEGYQNPMLVLVGKQEIGKSYFASWLCPQEKLFYRGAIQPDIKDCRLRLIDKLVWEVEELGSTTRRSDVEALKAFLTKEYVQDRKPYGHFDMHKPALASFIGTVNPGAGFLVDPSGNRRFVVTEITEIDWEYAEKIDPEQIWGQAMHLYHNSDEWRLTAADRKRRDTVNEEHQIDDPVHEFLAARIEVTGKEDDYIASDELNSKLDPHFNGLTPRSISMSAAAFLTSHDGVKKKRRTIKGMRATYYFGIVYHRKPRRLDKEVKDTDQEVEPLYI